ncbi:MAG: hypothetical protein R6U41_06420 [Desulfosalsimonas sp.]|uniref:hypothetical protein n=1 Tax=Desulfosalsimonas sp. TaxID=3073848 RepID=UPI003971071C
MEFEQNEIAAIYVNEAIVCTNCMKHEDWNLQTQDRVINREKTEKEDMIFFCDRCGEPI